MYASRAMQTPSARHPHQPLPGGHVTVELLMLHACNVAGMASQSTPCNMVRSFAHSQHSQQCSGMCDAAPLLPARASFGAARATSEQLDAWRGKSVGSCWEKVVTRRHARLDVHMQTYGLPCPGTRSRRRPNTITRARPLSRLHPPCGPHLRCGAYQAAKRLKRLQRDVFTQPGTLHTGAGICRGRMAAEAANDDHTKGAFAVRRPAGSPALHVPRPKGPAACVHMH